MNVHGTNRVGHILVVDDDFEIRDLLARFLKKHGYRVTTVSDGKEMREALSNWNIDLVILDLMLPGEDGLSLCRDLRTKSEVPIIMLTIIGDEADRIVGLEMGADDYIPKPFNPRELLARMRAVLRRGRSVPAGPNGPRRKILYFANWEIDLALRRLKSPDGVVIDLSAGEFDLLVAFAEHPQRVLNRDQLLDITHGHADSPFDRSIDMQVSRLRHKIEANPKQPELIKTVRGGGYVFTATVISDENLAT